MERTSHVGVPGSCEMKSDETGRSKEKQCKEMVNCVESSWVPEITTDSRKPRVSGGRVVLI